MFTDVNFYPISVTLGTIEEQIVAGSYNWSNGHINSENFTVDQPHDCCVILKSFDEDMCTYSVLTTLDDEGLRPATISELLALGVQHSELQRQFHIIALGSVGVLLHGIAHVGYLCGDASGRKLFLDCFDCDWRAGRCFACVCK